MSREVISKSEISEDSVDNNLRPRNFDEYVGQSKVKANMKVFIEAAKQRKEALDHVLLYGPPGLGKTTLAGIIAREMSVGLRVTSGPAIEKQGDLVALLTNLESHDVLFIDEIHRMPRIVEEILYPAMEDGVVDIIIGQGPSARSVRLDIAPFTLVGATTKAGLLSDPLRDRFGIICRLEMYDEKELTDIIMRSAKILNLSIDIGGAREIAVRSRCTPRIANRLLKRVRDFAQINNKGIIEKNITDDALEKLGINSSGLDEIDNQILISIFKYFKGGPVGLETLAATIGEDNETIEDVYEPYLLQCGFINRTSRGRVITEVATNYLVENKLV